ncbi:ABC transporter permease, partial [Vibrio diabolicus]|nr:ABC transporter permease [Vibrio diabolicus]
LGGRFNLLLALVGAFIIQSINTGILLSGYQPQWNHIVKSVVVLTVLILQSPAVIQLINKGRSHAKT